MTKIRSINNWESISYEVDNEQIHPKKSLVEVSWPDGTTSKHRVQSRTRRGSYSDHGKASGVIVSTVFGIQLVNKGIKHWVSIDGLDVKIPRTWLKE